MKLAALALVGLTTSACADQEWAFFDSTGADGAPSADVTLDVSDASDASTAVDPGGPVSASGGTDASDDARRPSSGCPSGGPCPGGCTSSRQCPAVSPHCDRSSGRCFR
jgi:hypothetical protein